MATTATMTDFYKLVATAGTPVALGTSATKFRTVTFFGCKAAKTDNTGLVYIRPSGGTGWAPLYPGGALTYTAIDSRPFSADQFEIDAATNGDGVLAVIQTTPAYDGP
jgi:hypothetical protein